MNSRFLKRTCSFLKVGTKENSRSNINYGLVMKEIRSNLEKLRNKEIIENEFAEQLYKIVQREEATKERQLQFVDTISNAVWVTDEVIKLALKETIAIISDIGYSDDVIADALETIAEVMQLRGKNAVVADDINGLDLFYDHRFEQIIDVFKYGLTPGNYISSRNIVRILKALIALEYKDLNLQKMVQQKLSTNRYLRFSDFEDSLAAAKLSEEQLLDLPLLNKKGFYNKGKEALTDVTLSNKFNSYISYIMNKFSNQNQISKKSLHAQKVASEFVPKQLIELLEGISPDFREKNQPQPILKPDELDPEEELKIKQVEEVTQALDYLKDVFNESKGALINVADSILRLREIYSTLGDLQKKDFVYENSSLMIDFMEVEELLVESGIISITDIKMLDKEGKLPREIKRIGPLIRQLVHEFGGSTIVIEHLEEFAEEDKPEEQVRIQSEKGMYRNHALEAFSALVDYANLESRDIHLQNTYAKEPYGKLINPDHDRELHVYKVEKRPLEALRNMYHDPLVDRRKLSVGRLPYLMSAQVIREYFRNLVSNQRLNFLASFPLTKENIFQLMAIASKLQSQELMHDIEAAILKKKHLVEKHEFEIDFNLLVQSFMKASDQTSAIDERLDLSDSVVFELFLESATRYEMLTPIQRIELIYNLALWGARSQVGSKAFELFYTNLVKNANNIWELCSNQNNCWLPLPDHLRKVHYVYFLAQGLGLPSSPGFEYLFNQILMSSRMNFGLKDNRDPVFNIVEDSLKNLLTDASYSSTQANLARFASELYPLGEVVSSFGYNTVIYLRHLDMIGPNHSTTNECEALSRIMQTYLAKMNNKPTVVVNIPYTAFLKDPQNLSSLELVNKETIAESLSKMYQVLSVVDVSHTPTTNLYKISPVSKDLSNTHSFLNREPWNKIERLIQASYEVLTTKTIPEDQRSIIETIHELKAALFSVIQYSEKPSTRYIQAIKILKINIFLFYKRILSLPYSDLQQIFKVFEVVTEIEFINSLKKINKRLTDIIAESGIKTEATSDRPIFAGRHQGLDMIDVDTAKQSKRFDFIEFFNYEYLSNPDFFSYSDWENQIIRFKPFFKHLQMSIGETSTPYGFVNYGVIPQKIADFDIARPSMFPLYWERQVYNFNTKLAEQLNEFDRMIYPEEALEKGSELETEINLKLALEKFKYDMKFKTNLKEQLDILFSTQIYKTILEKSLFGGWDASKSVKRLSRSEKGYRDFLERLQNERRTRSKFYKFAITQATKNDQLNYWKDVVYNKVPAMYRVVAR